MNLIPQHQRSSVEVVCALLNYFLDSQPCTNHSKTTQGHDVQTTFFMLMAMEELESHGD